MPEKIQFSEIQKSFLKANALLLITKEEHKDNKTKLPYKCEFGELHSITLQHWRKGVRCKCVNSAKRIEKYYNKTKDIIEYKGGKLLTSIEGYKTNKSKLDYLCKSKHLTEGVTFGSILNGHWCRKCADENHSSNMSGEGNSNYKGGVKTLGVPLYDTYNDRLSAFVSTYKVVKDGLVTVGTYCSYCKKPFDLSVQQVREILLGNNVYCSNSCSGKAVKNRLGIANANWKGGVDALNLPLYSTYANKLGRYQSIHLIEKVIEGTLLKLLGVECYYCKNIFVPIKTAVVDRCKSIAGRKQGESNLYCSEQCKVDCSTHGQRIYPKNFIPEDYKRDPEVSRQLRLMRLEIDNHKCQACFTSQRLECHHYDGVQLNPVESADLDRCITICYDCHKDTHKVPGYTYYDFMRKPCKT